MARARKNIETTKTYSYRNWNVKKRVRFTGSALIKQEKKKKKKTIRDQKCSVPTDQIGKSKQEKKEIDKTFSRSTGSKRGREERGGGGGRAGPLGGSGNGLPPCLLGASLIFLLCCRP